MPNSTERMVNICEKSDRLQPTFKAPSMTSLNWLKVAGSTKKEGTK